MLPLVVSAGMLLADLARPVSPEEYAEIMQQLLRHEPMSAGVRAHYLAKGRVLTCFLKKGMTDEEVERVLGVPASGGFGSACWYFGYFPLGAGVWYRLGEIEADGKRQPGFVVKEVEIAPP